MKKLLSLALTSMLALPLAAFGQGTLKIGTVNMDRAFKEYSKTKEAEKKINDAKDAAKKEFDDRTDAYKKALEEVNNLNKQLESQALSADKKTKLAKDRDDKINNIKNMEREINEFRQTRENQLREQALRMREGIVKEITEIVNDKVKTLNMDLVFDKSGMSFNGVPLVMYSRDSYDFTNDVVAALNKSGEQLAVEFNTRSARQFPGSAASAGGLCLRVERNHRRHIRRLFSSRRSANICAGRARANRRSGTRPLEIRSGLSFGGKCRDLAPPRHASGRNRARQAGRNQSQVF